MFKKLKEIYAYRQMLESMVLTDLRTRYKGSLLGFLWTFINPLLMLIIYSFVFSIIMRMNVPNYPMFLFVAILPWIFFQSSLQSSAGVIIRNSSLVKKIYFPREVLPLSVVLGGLVNYLFGLIILIPALLLNGIHLNIVLLWFPFILLIQMLLTLGLSFLVSAINVYFRDLEHIIGVFLQVGFYVTPIVFPVSFVPERYRVYFGLNPLTTIFESYRDIFIYGSYPNLNILFINLIISIFVLLIGWYFFQKLQKKFAEEI